MALSISMVLTKSIFYTTILSFGFLSYSSLALSFGSQTPLTKRSSSAPFGVTNDTSLAANRVFDYIIIGGGTAGLTVAARLVEEPSTTVLVVEAGADDRTNPLVFDIYNFGQAYGTELSWNWETVDGKVIEGGRTLGGSSSINGATWTRGVKAQYDAFSTLLEPEEQKVGWNWDSLFFYMKKAEGFTPPNAQQRANGADAINSFHGLVGPVKTGFPQLMFAGPEQPDYVETVRNLTGIKLSRDLNGGDPNCVSYVPNSININDDDHRSSSATSYLSPVENEPNGWLTLVSHQVTKILLTSKTNSVPYTATGINFVHTNSSSSPIFSAYARKEVILAAGAIATPKLLQLSGIGDKDVLQPLGIDTKINLRTVGRNFQDQTQNLLIGNSTPGFDPEGSGPADVIAFPSLSQLFGNKTKDVTQNLVNSIPQWAKTQSANGMNADALQTIFEAQAKPILHDNAPVAELFFATGFPIGIAIVPWTLLPFSRGNVTIVSKDPLVPPAVNVNWFSVPLDLDMQIAVSRLSRQMLTSPPLSEILTGEVNPGFSVIPDNGDGGSDEDWKKWILDPSAGFQSNSHPIATAAMMRRDLGGVVNSQLIVYDTTNLCVVDASILPFQISAHLSSTVYGVAEKVADLIKNRNH